MEYFAQEWDGFLAYLNEAPPNWIYFFLFLGAFMENIVPPIPGDTLIVFGAYLAGMGVIRVAPAYVAMWVGSAAGCLAVYAIAYAKGRDFFLRLEARFFDESNIETAETWFARYGSRIVIFNRFLPTVRAFVGIAAGIIRMNPLQMILYVLIGTFLWNSLLIYFGLMVGENWQLVIQVLKTYNQVVFAFALLIAGGYFGWKRWRSGGQGSREQGAREKASELIDTPASQATQDEQESGRG
jgi:membrane protein DedA with SNARE-associated domain